jgi:hypothetical protein
MLGTSDWSEGLLERAHKLASVYDFSYGVLSALDAFKRDRDKQTILSVLDLRSGTLSPSLQLIEMALRARIGDQNGAERVRQSLQKLGFTQSSDYFDLIDRACWTNQVKQLVRRLLSGN